MKETHKEKERQPGFEVVDLIEGGTSKDGNHVYVTMKTGTGDTVRCALAYSRLEKFQKGIRHLICFVKQRRQDKGLNIDFEGAPAKPPKIVNLCTGRRWSTENVVMRFNLDDGGFATFELDDKRLDALISMLTEQRTKKRRDDPDLRVVH